MPPAKPPRPSWTHPLAHCRCAHCTAVDHAHREEYLEKLNVIAALPMSRREHDEALGKLMQDSSPFTELVKRC